MVETYADRSPRYALGFRIGEDGSPILIFSLRGVIVSRQRKKFPHFIVDSATHMVSTRHAPRIFGVLSTTDGLKAVARNGGTKSDSHSVITEASSTVGKPRVSSEKIPVEHGTLKSFTTRNDSQKLSGASVRTGEPATFSVRVIADVDVTVMVHSARGRVLKAAPQTKTKQSSEKTTGPEMHIPGVQDEPWEDLSTPAATLRPSAGETVFKFHVPGDAGRSETERRQTNRCVELQYTLEVSGRLLRGCALIALSDTGAVAAHAASLFVAYMECRDDVKGMMTRDPFRKTPAFQKHLQKPVVGEAERSSREFLRGETAQPIAFDGGGGGFDIHGFKASTDAYEYRLDKYGRILVPFEREICTMSDCDLHYGEGAELSLFIRPSGQDHPPFYTLCQHLVNIYPSLPASLVKMNPPGQPAWPSASVHAADGSLQPYSPGSQFGSSESTASTASATPVRRPREADGGSDAEPSPKRSAGAVARFVDLHAVRSTDVSASEPSELSEDCADMMGGQLSLADDSSSSRESDEALFSRFGDVSGTQLPLDEGLPSAGPPWSMNPLSYHESSSAAEDFLPTSGRTSPLLRN